MGTLALVAESAPVTIVVPTHDRAALLEQAVDSITCQDHPDLEVLVVDDGSTDATPQVLEALVERHGGRVRWHRQEHRGQAAALNQGFSMAHGELIGYLSSDDLLLPGAVSKLTATLADDPAAVLAYPAYHVIDEAGEVVDTISPPEFTAAEAVRLQETIVGPAPLFRRAALEQAGGWSDAYRYIGDFELWLRMSKLGPFRRVPEPLACWRRHAGAITVADRGLAMARERVRLVDEVFAGDLAFELEEVRTQAYRNAYVLAGMVVGPGVNGPGERYHIADSHARAVSRASGPTDPELKLAEMRRRIADQAEQIGQLKAEVTGLRRQLDTRHPLLSAVVKVMPRRVRSLARRRLARPGGPAA